MERSSSGRSSHDPSDEQRLPKGLERPRAKSIDAPTPKGEISFWADLPRRHELADGGGIPVAEQRGSAGGVQKVIEEVRALRGSYRFRKFRGKALGEKDGSPTIDQACAAAFVG